MQHWKKPKNSGKSLVMNLFHWNIILMAIYSGKDTAAKLLQDQGVTLKELKIAISQLT